MGSNLKLYGLLKNKIQFFRFAIVNSIWVLKYICLYFFCIYFLFPFLKIVTLIVTIISFIPLFFIHLDLIPMFHYYKRIFYLF